jgi:hypothetical protein
MSIQHDAPDQLRNTLSDEHVAALKNLWQKNSTLTPTRAQNHYSLLDQQKNPLYTLEAIQQELDKLQANSARARTTAENRAARAANLLPPVVRTEAEDAGSRDSQPQSDEHSQQPGQVRVSVTDGNAIARFKISPNLPVDEFKARVQVALSLDPDDRRRMQLGYMTSEGWIVTHNDETWADALSDDVRSFQVRLVAGSGSLSSDAASSASTASSTAQPQRLAFEHDSRIQAQKQWEYENKLRTHIKDRVTAKLANDGTTVGSPAVGTSVAELRTLLRACSQLADEWVMLCEEQQHRDDGISESKLLEWFIDAVINKFHPSVAQMWQSNDPTIRARRLPTAFGSFDLFLAHLYLTVKPGVSGAPSTVLPAMLADLQGRWRSFTVRREICGEIRQVLVAAQFLNDHLFDRSAADLTMTIKVFLEGALSDAVQTELMSVLKQYHSADLSPIFRDSDDFAQLQAYSLESVLRRWAALDTKQGPLTSAEFKASWIGQQSGSSSGGGTGRGPGTSSRTTPSVAQPTTPPQPSAKEFHIKVNGQHIAFRQNLASWPDHQDRLREEAKFVDVVYQFDGQCHFCNQFGHREVGCPRRFKLDHNGQDLNPKSYFYTLIPPRVALEAGKTRASSGGGSNRGSGSGGGGRGGRGSDRSALAAVLEATARLETKMELMSREQQRDHDRVEQVAQQVGQQLGNDLAGAAH